MICLEDATDKIYHTHKRQESLGSLNDIGLKLDLIDMHLNLKYLSE